MSVRYSSKESEALLKSDYEAAVDFCPSPKTGLTLEWRNLTYRIPLKPKKPTDPTEKKILNNVSGLVTSGQLLAIMGPSGSGKTSLLNSLAGRVPLTKGAELTGQVLVDGVDVMTEKLDMPRISAYVMQDDALFALSTVEETLMFVAHMRLPSSLEYSEKHRRVQQVILELGLIGVANTVIGSVRVRGLSGGERKRVNIGVDLLHNPRLIFVDEPTSGLDSFQALSVMETLSSLAKKGGRTVVCSVHQPRSAIYNMLDMMLLLSLGKPMYFGRAGTIANDYFSAAGSPVPPDFNPADHFLDVISVDYRTQKAIDSTQATVRSLREYYDRHINEPRGEVSRASSKSCRESDYISSFSDHVEGASFFLAFLLLLRRSWREQTRDKMTLVIKYTMNTFFSAMFGFVYFRMKTDQTSIQNRTGILFFMAMNQAFGSSIGISQVIPVQLKVVSRERAAKMYGTIPYYLATFITCIPLELIPQFVYSVAVYYMTGLRPGWDYLLTYIGIMMLENFVAIGLGMLLSASFESAEMAGQIAPAVVVLFLMFSGYFLNEDSIPWVLGWLKYISFIRYAFQALCVNEFSNASFSCDPPPAPCLDGDQWLDNLNFGNVTIPWNSLYLVIELLVLHFMALMMMMYKRPKFLKMSVASF